MSQQNRELAAALRANGLTPNGDVWANAKALLAKGSTVENAAAHLGMSRPRAVHEPVAQYHAPKRAAKAKQAKPRKQAKPEPTYATAVAVQLTREGSPTLYGTLGVSELRKKHNGSGKTHDAALNLTDAPVVRFTLSPSALARFDAGKGTRVWVNAVAYVMQPLPQ